MKVTESPIPGVEWREVDRFADARGSFREIWRASRSEHAFVQGNLSESNAGVLRGLHLHQRQWDAWTIASGRAFVALVDVRPILTGTGTEAIVETRVAPVDVAVVIPPGVAHGFLALEALTLLYMVTNEYDATDEHGFRWDDPAVAVPWPPITETSDGRPILSERDLAAPLLADLIAQLRNEER